jgi:predicted nucleic-acid-binding protein
VKGRASKTVGEKIAVDTNVLVRYFTWDDEKQCRQAAQAIEGASMVVVSMIVLCELAWVLKRAYGYDDDNIREIIQRMAKTRTIELDRPATEAGLAMLATGGDFADGVIQFEADRAKCERLVTFDRKFARAGRSASIQLLGTA